MYLEHTKLTKEEKRAVKKGKAWNTWRKKLLLAFLFYFIWSIVSIIIISITKSITDSEVVETVVGFVLLMLFVYVFIRLTYSAWRCPNCNIELPAIGVGTRACIPKPVLRCPCCDYDLTDGNLHYNESGGFDV